jgi:hypothetical protein
MGTAGKRPSEEPRKSRLVIVGTLLILLASGTRIVAQAFGHGDSGLVAAVTWIVGMPGVVLLLVFLGRRYGEWRRA